MYESSNFKCLQFLLCLHFAVVNSEYVSVLLKRKQVACLEAAYLGRDLLAVLPTGYGKSIIFHLLSALLVEKKRRSGIRGKDPVIIVIFPLNSLIQDKLQRINAVRTRAAVLSVKNEQLNPDLTNVDELRLKNADYEYVLTHPESCLQNKEWRCFRATHINIPSLLWLWMKLTVYWNGMYCNTLIYLCQLY